MAWLSSAIAAALAFAAGASAKGILSLIAGGWFAFALFVTFSQKAEVDR